MDNTTDERAQLLQHWLSQHYDIVENSFTTVSGDASFRRYFRFTAKNVFGIQQVSLIAVDAPPEKENSQPFIEIAKLLFDNRLPVPEIYHYSLPDGFYVQQDFGDQLLYGSLNEQSADYLYGLAIDSIVDMQSVSSDTLPPYDANLLQREMHLFSDWYLTKHLSISLDTSTKDMLEKTYLYLEHNALEQPQVFVHRDYHSRNLMVVNYDTLGIIDFQDAVKGPLTYDIVSLLRDCYIDWPSHKVNQWLTEFNSKLTSSFDINQLTQWFDLMGIQRHLKATGIFCRLNYRDGKPGYLDDIPRTMRYVQSISGKYDELKPFNLFINQLL